MKNQKYLFNSMLLSYNRYVRKLKRLIANGLNLRKQEILEKRIGNLFKKLTAIHLSMKKAIAFGSIICGLTFIPQSEIKAQTFGVEQINPFGLNSLGYYGDADAVDIDGDGDIDIVSSNTVNTFNSVIGNTFYENIGTPSSPFFDSPVFNPSWITEGALPTKFADIDGDGDYDMFEESDFFENIGTPQSPLFGGRQVNPFSIRDFEFNIEFVDIDTDGDLDIMSVLEDYYEQRFAFYENIGTVTSPLFDLPVENPFSTIPYSLFSHGYSDLDYDGDIDILATDNDGYGFSGGFYYLENSGDANNPTYENPVYPSSPTFVSGSGFFGVLGFSFTFEDMNGDGFNDLIALAQGDFRYYEAIPIETCPKIINLSTSLKPTGYKLSWQPLEGSTKCEIAGGKVGGYQTSYTKYGNEPSSVFLNFSQIKPNRDYQWKVRCNCESNEDFGTFSDYNYFSTGSHSNMNSAKTADEIIFAEENNISTNDIVKLFPNPAKGSFAINTDLENYNVELRDVTGKLVYTKNNINQTTFNLAINHIEAGTYFVQISNQKSKEVIKLMVY